MDVKREKQWIEKSYKKSNDSLSFNMDNFGDSRVNNIKWRHKIPLKNGQVTRGTKDTSVDLQQFDFSNDLFKDKTVADIGACDGFFSFHAEQQGAKEVLAIDPYRWTLDDRWSGMEGFKLAREINESKVKDSVELLEDLSPDTTGMWDVTLFLGVFYHLVNPIQILHNVASITKETVVVETINAEYFGAVHGCPQKKENGEVYLDKFFIEKPMLYYYPTNEVDGDYTTWYAANPEYIKQFLTVEGFTKFDIKRIYGGARFIITATR